MPAFCYGFTLQKSPIGTGAYFCSEIVDLCTHVIAEAKDDVAGGQCSASFRFLKQTSECCFRDLAFYGEDLVQFCLIGQNMAMGDPMRNAQDVNVGRSQIYSVLIFIGMAFFSTAVPTASSAQELSVQEWVDQFVATCVGSGSSDIASGEIGADGDISLKKLTLSGTVKGQVQITHKEARLLSDGINNSMTQVAADQAASVRDCLKPIRSVLLNVMQSQFSQSGLAKSTIYILTHEEDKIVGVLAITKGYFGKSGEAVLETVIKEQTGLGDIRFNSAMRRLTEKGYAYKGLDFGTGQTVSLGAGGEDYALSVGFTN